MARVRTLKEAYNTIKAEDEGTAISYTLIRRLVLNNKVPTMKSGKKYLVDVDALLKHINEELSATRVIEDTKAEKENGITAIPERLRRRTAG